MKWASGTHNAIGWLGGLPKNTAYCSSSERAMSDLPWGKPGNVYTNAYVLVQAITNRLEIFNTHPYFYLRTQFPQQM